jgi:hypothetical protein
MSYIVQDSITKIKYLSLAMVRRWGMHLCLTLIVLLSFGLGRLSGLLEIEHIRIESESWAGHIEPRNIFYVKGIVETHIYAAPWCTAYYTDRDVETREFTTEKNAIHAGYYPAKNCPGIGY